KLQLRIVVDVLHGLSAGQSELPPCSLYLGQGSDRRRSLLRRLVEDSPRRNGPVSRQRIPPGVLASDRRPRWRPSAGRRGRSSKPGRSWPRPGPRASGGPRAACRPETLVQAGPAFHCLRLRIPVLHTLTLLALFGLVSLCVSAVARASG